MQSEYRVIYTTYNSGLWYRNSKIRYGKLSKHINELFVSLCNDIEPHQSWAGAKLKSVDCCPTSQSVYITFVIVVANKVEFNKKKLTRPNLQADFEYLDSLVENRVPLNAQDITDKVEEFYRNQQKVYG